MRVVRVRFKQSVTLGTAEAYSASSASAHIEGDPACGLYITPEGSSLTTFVPASNVVWVALERDAPQVKPQKKPKK